MEIVSFIQLIDEDRVTVIETKDKTDILVNDPITLLSENDLLIQFIYRLGEPRNMTDFLISAVENTSEDFDTFDLVVGIKFTITDEHIVMKSTVDIGMEYDDENGERTRGRLAKMYVDIPLADWEREYMMLVLEAKKRV